MNEKYPIFVTGVERSGSSIIAKIIGACGAFTGTVNTMQENIRLKRMLEKFINENPNDDLLPVIDSLFLPSGWQRSVNDLLTLDSYKKGIWLFKDSKLTQTWPIWHYAFPEARWIIVRRKTPDIIQSCVKTGYMKTFKTQAGRDKINAATEEAGWLWWIHQYEDRFRQMAETLQYKEVWPERLAVGDYEQIKDVVAWAGLKWNDNIPNLIDPMFEKSRRV